MDPNSGASGLTPRPIWPVIVRWPLIEQRRLSRTPSGASPTKTRQKKTELASQSGIIVGSTGRAGLSEDTRHNQRRTLAERAGSFVRPGLVSHPAIPAASCPPFVGLTQLYTSVHLNSAPLLPPRASALCEESAMSATLSSRCDKPPAGATFSDSRAGRAPTH